MGLIFCRGGVIPKFRTFFGIIKILIIFLERTGLYLMYYEEKNIR